MKKNKHFCKLGSKILIGHKLLDHSFLGILDPDYFISKSVTDNKLSGKPSFGYRSTTERDLPPMYTAEYIEEMDSEIDSLLKYFSMDGQ